MSTLDPGPCPLCGSEDYTAHCVKRGCGWWLCSRCEALFNALGGFSRKPGAA